MNIDHVMSIIDGFTGPDEMSKRDAKDWLEELYDAIQCRIDCLVDELRNEEDGE